MSNIDQPSKAIVHTLGKYLKTTMPSIMKVFDGWPESNLTVEHPSLTIMTIDPGYTHEMNPYEYKYEVIKDAKYKFLYVVGEYNTSLQLDIWCRNKAERYRVIDEFQKAFLGSWPDLSLLLPMENYHDIICRYDVEDYNFDSDGEVSSQTKEWRVKIDLLAHCKAVHSREEFAILTTELDTENVNETVEIE